MYFKFIFSTAVVASLIFIAHNSIAQEQTRCGNEVMYAKKIAENSTIAEQREAYRQERAHADANPIENRAAVRIIPVVFHVIHQNGSENISKEQIQDAIAKLNLDFSLTNPDAVNLRSTFTSVQANAEIEFRLANKDPNGNCTDGIVRIYSPYTTDGDDEDIKDLSRWPNTKYLNIWTVKSIAGSGDGVILGYAYLPDVVAWGPDLDGIVVRSDRVGTIGTSNGTGRTLTHEIGHYLGLDHTFEGGCSGSGDGVSDTPKAADANFGCDYTINSCTNENPDKPDMIENYMDYSNDNCQIIFTAGQKSVFNNTFSQYRSTLISGSNLIATGTNDLILDVCSPIASFAADAQTICEGGSITYSDESWGGDATSWDWSFPGGTPATSTEQNPTITYNTAGTYSATLVASNNTGNDSFTRTNYVTVSGDAMTNAEFYSEGFESSSDFSSDWTIVNYATAYTWERNTSYKYSGTASVRMNNYSNAAGEVDDLISPSYNLGMVNDPTMTFKYAFAQRTTDNTDRLRVQVSTNCGETWSTRWVKSNEALGTVTAQNGPFYPNSQAQWEEVEVSIPTNVASADNVRFKFEFTGGGGNFLYIDDINITGAVGISEAQQAGISVYPNPATNAVTVELANEMRNVKAEIRSITGQVISQSSITNQKSTLDISNLSSGIYFLRLFSENLDVTEKIVVAGK
jgi:PKD repeat protein